MNLTIDIGNSRNKFAIFRKGEILEIFNFNTLNTNIIEGITQKYPDIKQVILSTVRKVEASFLTFLQSEFNYSITPAMPLMAGVSVSATVQMRTRWRFAASGHC
ncbi:MAG TPA: hypothetical protein VK982_05065 [Bacteroidales bacterium]|nr:hypothetical protein [Bacteroidales bacterium]